MTSAGPSSTEPLTRLRRVVCAALLVGVTALLLQSGYERALVVGVVGGSTYSLMAVGLVLVYKSSGVFNFAQGEFGTVAVYTLYLLHSANVPYAFAVLAALSSAVAVGLVVEVLVVRRLSAAPKVTMLVATAGVTLLAIGVQMWLGQPRLRAIDPALPRLDRLEVLGTQVSDQRLLLLAALLTTGAALTLFFTRTFTGLAVLAASEQAVATELMGIRLRRLSRLVWGMAAFIGGIAGVLTAPIVGSFGPGYLTSGGLIAGFTAAVLGGMTSVHGAFMGGIVVGTAQALAVDFDVFQSAGIPAPDAVVLFIMLVVVLALRPQGLLAGRHGRSPQGQNGLWRRMAS